MKTTKPQATNEEILAAFKRSMGQVQIHYASHSQWGWGPEPKLPYGVAIVAIARAALEGKEV